MHCSSILTTLALVLMLSLPLSADDDNGIRQVGRCFDFWDEVESIAVQGNYAYVASGLSGLRILDISDPVNPVQVGKCERSHLLSGIAVQGDYVYATSCDFRGFYVVDVSDPTDPFEVTFLRTEGFPKGIEVDDDFLYIADGTAYEGPSPMFSGVTQVYDIWDPTDPILISTVAVSNGSMTALSMQEEFVYGVDRRGRTIVVIDRTNPDDIHELSRHRLDVYPYDIQTQGTFAFVAVSHSLIVMDIHDPERRIFEVAELEFDEDVRKVIIDRDLAYVVENGYGIERTSRLWVVDISNPIRPEKIDFTDYSHAINDIDILDETLCLTIKDVGVSISSLRDPLEPDKQSLTSNWGEVSRIAAYQDCAVIADPVNGLWTVDISNPESPEQVGFLDTRSGVTDVVVQDEYAYLVNGDQGFSIIDLTDPALPVEVGHLELNGYVTMIDVQGDRAYVSREHTFNQDDPEGLTIIDISDPEHPRRISDSDQRICGLDIAVSGDFLYRTGFKMGITCIDISDPENIEIVGRECWEGGGNAIAIRDRVAYIADGEFLTFVNITDPESPQVIDWMLMKYATGVTVSGDYLFVADDDSGLTVFDISEPMFPVETGKVTSVGGYGADIAVWDSYAMLANTTILEVFDCSGALGLRSPPYFIDLPDTLRSQAGEYLEYLVRTGDLNGDNVYLEMDYGNIPYPAEFIDNEDGTGTFWWDSSPEDAGTYEGGLIISDNHHRVTQPIYVVLEAPNSVKEKTSEPPVSFCLKPGFPNPFNASTSMLIGLPQSSSVTLKVYDLNGREVSTLLQGNISAGWHGVVWNANDLPGGMYFAQLVSGKNMVTQRLTLIR